MNEIIKPIESLRLDLTRRNVLTGGAALAGAVAMPAIVRAADVIKIGHVSPRTGPMAGFAEADDYMIGQIREILKPGLKIGGKTYTVEIIQKDSQTDESRASEVANELALKDKVDILTACSGSIDCNPVANVAELNGIPCVTADDPWESYWDGRKAPKEGFEWTYHFFWGLNEVLTAFIGLWDTQPTNKVVGTLFNTLLDDTSWHNAFIPAIKAAGYTVVDPGQFPAFGNDFTAQIGAFKKANVEIVTGNLFPPDFGTFWTQCAQQGYKPKIVTLGKAFLFPVRHGGARAGLERRDGGGLVLALSSLQIESDRRELQGSGRQIRSDYASALDGADLLQTRFVRGRDRRAEALEGREGPAVDPRRHQGDGHQLDRRPCAVDGQAGEERLHDAGRRRSVAVQGRQVASRARRQRRLPEHSNHLAAAAACLSAKLCRGVRGRRR